MLKVFNMKYIVEIVIPQLVEVEASSESEAINIVKNRLPQLKTQDNIDFKIVRELTLGPNNSTETT